MTTQFLGDSRFVGAGRLRLGILLLPLVLGFLGTLVLLLILRPATVVSALEESNIPANLEIATSVSAGLPSTPTLHITKSVDPTHIDPGGTVSICFTIKRPGLDVVLVQDVSGSMNEQDASVEDSVTETTRLTASKKAAIVFVRSLQNTDRGAVVPYSTTAYVAQPLTTSRIDIAETITDLKAMDDWHTNIGKGIEVAHRELITSSCHLVKAMILLSDGRANHPVGTAEDEARARALAAHRDDIKIYTIGFGSDANEDLLQDIAAIGGGEYFSTPDVSVLENTYLTVALELHNLVITDILTPGIEVDCSQWPDDLCAEGPGGVTTVTFPISASFLISNPVTRCFTATVNLEPNYVGPINAPHSGFCYQDSSGHRLCERFDNPVVTVTKRQELVFLPAIANNYPPPIITNGGFEDGWTGWEYGGELSQTVTSTNPHSGNYSALLGNPNYECKRGVPIGSASITQAVTVPPTDYPRLSFWYNIFTYDKNPKLNGVFDTFDVRINGTLFLRDMNTEGPYQCTIPVIDLGWRHKIIDLSGFSGHYITITFENWNRFDHRYNTWTYVDGVEVWP